VTDAASRLAEQAALLSQVPLLSRLDRVALARLAAHLEMLSFRHDEVLCRQGEPPTDGVYLITAGRVAVYATAGDGQPELRLGVRGAGEIIGEMALVSGEPRSATVRALGSAKALRLERAHFLDFIHDHPAASLAIASNLAQRLHTVELALVATAPTADQLQAALPLAARPPEEHRADTRPAARLPRRNAVALLLALALGVGGWLVPPPAGLQIEGWHALVCLVAAIPVLATQALPDPIAGLLLVAGWVLGGVAPPGEALDGFASTQWVLVVCLLAVGAGVSVSGAVYRLALWAVEHLRGGYPGQAIALAVAGLLLGPAMPYVAGRVTLMGTAVSEIANAYGYRPRSRQAAGLAMAVHLGFGQTGGAFLTSSTTTLLVYAALPPDARAGVGWLGWAARSLPTHLLLVALCLAGLLYFYRPGAGAAAAQPGSVALQQAILGRTTGREKIAMGVVAALALGLATQPLHGLDLAWISLAAAVALAAAGVLSTGELRGINWGFTVLYGVLTSAGTVLTQTGAARWLSEQLAGTLGALVSTPVLFVGATALLCYAIGFLVRSPIGAPLLTIALAPVARAGGIDPWVVGLTAVVAGNAFFFPYQSSTYVALFEATGGRLFDHAQARPMSVVFAVGALVALCASVPLWSAMGLL
jgi:DASS family divalent anion:Na+ symporter